MKVRKVHLWLLVLLLTVVAVVPGVGAQGDFMTLALGDTEQVVQEKLAALECAKQVEVTSPTTFAGRFLDQSVECSVNFFQGRLYQILILFPGFAAGEYEKGLRYGVEEQINPALIHHNGTPSVVYEYPDREEVDSLLRLTAEWDFNGKAILSGVMNDKDGYHAKVEIYDNRLVAGR